MSQIVFLLRKISWEHLVIIEVIEIWHCILLSIIMLFSFQIS